MLRPLSLAFLTAGLIAQAPPLPKALQTDLKRLEEAWHLLDLHAEAIWPGWTSYKAVPFKFAYPNQVEMLVGHPDPTDGFVPAGDLKVAGKPVLLDRRREIPLALEGRLQSGGGILGYGKTKLVNTVDYGIRFADKPQPGSPKPDALQNLSDRDMLVHVHELFHCFQRERRSYQFGNFQFNPDTHYAVWSEVEGLALERAYLERDAAKSRAHLVEFLAARRMKRSTMLTLEANQESEDELMEGTATYAEARLLECVQGGYQPSIGTTDDPWYGGFKEAKAMLDEKLEKLRSDRKEVLEARMKAYTYGCFQALLLTRHAPEWRKGFMESKRMLDADLQTVLGATPETLDRMGRELEVRYPVEAIRARIAPVVAGRDKAYQSITARKGRSYVLNFKPIQEFLNPEVRGESYKLGLMRLLPQGVKRLELHDIRLEGRETPMLQDQLYYLKWVDTMGGKDGFKVTGRREAQGIWVDATFSCGGFTLKAPRIQVREEAGRVKVDILAKVSGPASQSGK